MKTLTKTIRNGALSVMTKGKTFNFKPANMRAVLPVALVAFSMLAPELAHAGAGTSPWDGAGDAVLDLLTGGLTRSIAIIAVIAAGIAGIAGKLSWDWVIKIVIGITLIFGAPAIVTFFSSAAGG